MELGLQGKVAIITGGSDGIGKAAASALAAEGADEAGAPAAHAFSRDPASTYFWSASATSDSATASPTNEATR